ncbi:retrovirus-related Pol polyprotein from transposon 297 [Trichonephila clavipes]|nr:retrovirus-related Pol polyprotein from transposon 297 [Trichonephila clavipes]
MCEGLQQTQLKSRQQKVSETLQELATDVERLSHLAFLTVRLKKQTGRRPLNAGTAVEKGICREAAGHAKALKIIKRLPEGGVKLINDHLVGRRLPDFRKPPLSSVSNFDKEHWTEIIVPGYIGNDVSFNSGLIGSDENKANGLLIASTLVDLSRKLSRTVSSPWASPIVLVRKKDGSTRFCVDYRKLNDVTKKDSYPLPRIDDTLINLSGHKWFSTLDLKSGYWQVEIHPEDREKTAFTSGQGLWQFKVMPFGLCNAPATFERLMETVLKGLTFEACLIYLDDVIIGGRTFEEHLQNIRKVLSKLSDANLKLNPSKCKFFQKEVNYLGHIISAEGVRTDPEKVSAVKN